MPDTCTLDDIAHGRASPALARVLVMGLLDNPGVSEDTLAGICNAFRSRVHKAITHLDADLSGWHDTIHASALLVESRNPRLGGKLEGLHELLSDSLADKRELRDGELQYVKRALEFMSGAGRDVETSTLGGFLYLEGFRLAHVLDVMTGRGLIETVSGGTRMLRITEAGLVAAPR